MFLYVIYVVKKNYYLDFSLLFLGRRAIVLYGTRFYDNNNDDDDDNNNNNNDDDDNNNNSNNNNNNNNNNSNNLNLSVGTT